MQRAIRPVAASIAIAGIAIGAWGFGRAARARAPEALPGLEARAWINADAPIALESSLGRPVLIEYWATWCPACLRSIPVVNAIQRKFAARGLVVVAVAEESAPRVASFVRKYDIDYIVAAEASRATMARAQSLPHAVLIGSDGTLQAEGPLEAVRAALDAIDWSRVSARAAVGRRGASTVSLAERPVDARNYGPADFAVALERLEETWKKQAPTAAQVERLFAFHWRNLPHDGWPGDSETRFEAAVALRRCLGSRAVGTHAESELCDRLDAGEPDKKVRLVLLCPAASLNRPPSARLLATLRFHAEQEPDPLVANSAAWQVRKLAGTLTADDDSIDPRYDALREKYQALGSAWRSRVLGFPAPFDAVARFENSISTRATAVAPAEWANYLMGAYQEHRGLGDADLLIRDSALANLLMIPSTNSLPVDTRRSVQRFLFAIAQDAQESAYLRNAALRNLDAFGMEAIDRAALQRFLLDWRGRTTQHDVRATLAHWQLKLTDPARLDAPCPVRPEAAAAKPH